MSKAVMLTNDPRLALVDDEDYDRICQHRWTRMRSSPGYAYTYLAGRGTFTYLHRFVLGFKPGDPGVDHRNRDPLDCQKENLRPIGQAGNLQNLSAYSERSRSGHRNVYWSTQAQKYYVQMHVGGGKRKNFGCFNDPEKAALVAKEARRLYMPYATE